MLSVQVDVWTHGAKNYSVVCSHGDVIVDIKNTGDRLGDDRLVFGR